MAAVLSWCVAAAVPAAAQMPTRPEPPPAPERPGEHLVALGINVAIGGLTAGIRQWRHDGSFLDGFWRGGLGGAGTFAGKLIVAGDFTGSGVIGRTVAATGASMSRNAADGVPTFHRLVVPVGPVRLHWQPAAGSLHTSLDVIGLGAIVGNYVSDVGASFDLRESLSSGAPVFLARSWESDWGWHARHAAGTILLRGDDNDADGHDRLMRRIRAHERVHVLQYDQAWILWSQPVERRALTALGAPPLVVRSVDLSFNAAAMLLLNGVIPYDSRPWEVEADLLSQRHSGGRGHHTFAPTLR